MEIQQLFNQLAYQGPKKPRKQRIAHIYSRDYYDTNVKAGFDVLWAEEQKRPLKPGEKPMKCLDYSNRITAQYLEAESGEFRAWLKSVCESEHQAAMQKWNAEKEQGNEKEKETPSAESYQK